VSLGHRSDIAPMVRCSILLSYGRLGRRANLRRKSAAVK